MFDSEETKVAFAINQLAGRTRLWGTAEWDRQISACASFEAFPAELRKVFGQGFRVGFCVYVRVVSQSSNSLLTSVPRPI